MKKTILAGLILLLSAGFVKADPPKSVNLSYNAETGKLKIESIHKVKNVEEHYIDKIVISVNDKEVKTIKPTKQTSLASDVQEVSVPEIKKGVTVHVSSRCNRFGTKTADLKI